MSAKSRLERECRSAQRAGKFIRAKSRLERECRGAQRAGFQ
jgi:hypothetical protein